MSRQKKNIIMLIMAILLVGGLSGVYLWQSREVALPDYTLHEEEEDIAATILSGNIILIDKTEADIASVAYSDFIGHNLTLVSSVDEYGEIVWAMQEAPHLVIYQSMAREMVRAFHYLSAEDMIFEQVENPADFGIGSNITATATYKDGSTHTIHVGSLTPNHERFYMMLEGDPALYLFYTYFGTRFMNTASDLIDRTIPYLLMDGAEYLLINERGREPIEFAFKGNEQEKEDMYQRFGMVTVHMTSPHLGRELYYGNIDALLMDDFNTYFRLGEMRLLNPTDYARFGLDEPSLELKWISMHAVDQIHLLFGDRTEDGMIYVRHGDSPEVYVADFEAVRNFYGVNPFLFVDRFMALIDILDVDTVEINHLTDTERNYTFVMNHDKTEPTEWHPEGRDLIFPTVNGTEIEDTPFRNMYRHLIGMTSDVDIEPFEPTGDPEFAVTFHMRDGSPPIVTAYYLYETHFLAMSRDGAPCVLVISRQATEDFFRAVGELLE
jgi:hypothetical protein